jgi:hypothetical protein
LVSLIAELLPAGKTIRNREPLQGKITESYGFKLIYLQKFRAATKRKIYMYMAQNIWEWTIRHWPDVVVAIFLAVLADVLRIGSLLRTAVRHLKDKLAEQSAEGWRTRIANQQQYRDRIAEYLGSDKALYLDALQMIMVVLMFVAFAIGILAIGNFFPGILSFNALAALCALIAIVCGIQGIQRTYLDTPSKISTVVADLDKEIAAMKAKLPAVSRPLGAS